MHYLFLPSNNVLQFENQSVVEYTKFFFEKIYFFSSVKETITYAAKMLIKRSYCACTDFGFGVFTGITRLKSSEQVQVKLVFTNSLSD